jgi:hypothetical protein
MASPQLHKQNANLLAELGKTDAEPKVNQSTIERLIGYFKKVEKRHEEIAERIEHVSMAAGVISGLFAAAALLATPTGVVALLVWAGVINAPLIVSASPKVAIISTVLGTLSGCAYFYSRWRRSRIINKII